MCCNSTVYSSVQLQQNLLEPKLPAHFAVNLQYTMCCNLTAENTVNAKSCGFCINYCYNRLILIDMHGENLPALLQLHL